MQFIGSQPRILVGKGERRMSARLRLLSSVPHHGLVTTVAVAGVFGKFISMSLSLCSHRLVGVPILDVDD